MLHIFYSITLIKNAIERIPDQDIICCIQESNTNVIINEDNETIIQKFREENVDILFSAEMIKPKNIYNDYTNPAKSEHKYLSSVGFIGFRHAINNSLSENSTIFDDSNTTNTININQKENQKILIGIDTKTTIFLNMHLVNWKDIWIKNGQIYNRILEETPSIVIFNYNSWQTNEQANIITILLDKIEKSRKIHLPLNINQYTPSYNAKLQLKTSFEHTKETRNTLQKIDRIIYINLDKRTDRRKEIEDELERYGLTEIIERFPAISREKGIVGCTYSHLNVYKMAKERNYKNVLILEDDFIFLAKKRDFYENLNKLFTRSIEFDVCMLAYNNTQSPLQTEYDFLMKTVEAQTASAYIVNSCFYDKLIELYEWAAPLLEETDKHWIYANDQVWKRLQSDATVKWYCFKERIGKQQDGYSDNSQQFMELIEH
jgi:glycosyl transferase family 25